MVDIPNILKNKFVEAAQDRGDDADAALERLMLEYIRQDETIAELFKSTNTPVASIDDYDPDDNRPLGYEAANALPSYAGTPMIDPDDVDDDRLPQYRNVKREVILGVLRYQHDRNHDDDRRHNAIIRRDDVARAAEAVIGEINQADDYRRDEYIEQVMDELLLRNPGDERMAFFAPSDAQEYLESLEPGDHKEESDVYHLSRHLFDRYKNEIDIETVNTVRRRYSFRPLE